MHSYAIIIHEVTLPSEIGVGLSGWEKQALAIQKLGVRFLDKQTPNSGSDS